MDDFTFKCVNCSHYMMFHFHATDHCQELDCSCEKFVSELMKFHGKLNI